MKTFRLLSIVILLTTLLFSCSGERSKFVGRWKVYSSQSPKDTAISIESLDDFYIFRDEQFLRSGYEDYKEYWGSDSQKYEVKDDKLSIYFRNSELIDFQFTYEFVNDSVLKLNFIKPEGIEKSLITLKKIGDK